jgi:hypothetical protein
MGFRRSDLQEAFFVAGSHPFRVWGYGTTDPLAEVLGRSYFRAAGGLMHPGDLIYVAVRPQAGLGVAVRPTGGSGSLRPQLDAGRGEVRMALVMVRGGENGAPSVRLVQDFGCPYDPDAPLATLPAPAEPAAPATTAPPQKRGRGRPPGSRTRKKTEAEGAEG